MKKKNIFQTIFVVLAVCISVTFTLQDSLAICFGPSSGPPSPQPEAKPTYASTEDHLKAIDAQIVEARREIIGLKKAQIEWQEQAMEIFTAEKPPPPEQRLDPDFPWDRKVEGRRSLRGAKDCEEAIEVWKQRLTRLEQEKRALTSQTGGCFLPDTLVSMADGSVKPFEKIRPGDQVLTYDIGYQTMVSRPVVEVYTVEGNHLYTINGELSTTGSERLLSSTGWKRVSDLQEGDEVRIDGSMVKIVSINYHREDRTLYNMQVDDSHNFYIVTDSGARYLVHNSSSGGAK